MNPILVELTRGGQVESVHRGAFAVADAGGAVIAALGDVATPVYSRSSLKPMQAMVLVESGAAEAFGLSDEEISLACASHSGEPMHTERVAAWLARIGCLESDLACGAHPSRHEPTYEAMVCAGEKPTRLHNNCSGKHTGFLTVARHWDIGTDGYERVDHPVQKAVAAVLKDLSGASDLPYGIDGCAAPNFATSLADFARAASRMASGHGLEAPRASAARRILQAMMNHPEMMSGTGRSCAALIRSSHARVAVKTGAEGFFGGWIPERGIGIAVKIDDGAHRASETVIAALLDKLGLLGDLPSARALLRGPVLNTRNTVVGEKRPAEALESFRIAGPQLP
jgi:L-asparaginase II